VTSKASGAARLRALGLPEGLIDLLTRQGPSGASPVRAVPLEGDASDRKYLRLVVEGPGGGDQGSYVLMQLSTPWVPQGSRRELPFVNVARHLSEKGIPVPRVFFDASEEGFVLLEDLGNVTLESHLERESLRERRRRYESAVEILVRMQSEASTASSHPCYALSYSFDAETFFRELCFFRDHALEGLWGHHIPTDGRTELDEHFHRLCTEIAGYPKVFTHRDYHARNLMVQADRLTLLDFQDARLGPITYDLASLLRDSYVSLAPEEQDGLIGHYRELAQRTGLACPGPDEFQQAFLRTGLQRNLKAIGTFAYQAVVKGVDRYLPSIPNTVDSIRSVFEGDAQLAPFRRALEPFLDGL
jgi:aminoglycoside/choline kinase family phosphotransferase